MIAIFLLLVIIALLCLGVYGYMYYIKELKRQLESNRGCPVYPAYPDCPACNVKCPACPSYPGCPDSSVSKSSISNSSIAEVSNEVVSENEFDGGFSLWLNNCNDMCQICKGRGYSNCDEVCSNCNKEYYDQLS